MRLAALQNVFKILGRWTVNTLYTIGNVVYNVRRGTNVRFIVRYYGSTVAYGIISRRCTIAPTLPESIGESVAKTDKSTNITSVQDR